MNQINHALSFILIAGVVFVVFIVVEWMASVRLGKVNVYDLGDVLVNIATSVIYKIIDGLFLALIISVYFENIRNLGLMYSFSGQFIEWVVVFLLMDLLFYIMHLVMHKTRYAWAAHVTHHSSSRFNFSTALRQNFLLDLSGVCLIIWIPLALIGLDMIAIIVLIELSLFYQFFLHTQFVKKLPKWVEYIFNTPSHHRVHHGCGERQIDKNFGGVLIVWDRVFGTFEDEEDAGEILYGIIGESPKSLNPFVLNMHEWIAMWRDVWKQKRVELLWRSPGYLSDKRIKRKIMEMKK